MTVIDPRDDRQEAARRARHRLRPGGRDQEELQEAADAAADQGRRPGLLRQPLGRHRLARPDAALPQAWRALYRHGGRAMARLLFRRQGRQCEPHQLRAARDRARGKARRSPAARPRSPACGANPGMVSWFVKQALVNLATDLGLEFRGARAGRSRRLGEADEEGRRQGHPHRRARHAAHQEAEADQRVLEHLVGRRLHLGRPAAGRARLGHAREMDAEERQEAQAGLQGRDLPRAAGRQYARAHAGARRRARNTASW